MLSVRRFLTPSKTKLTRFGTSSRNNSNNVIEHLENRSLFEVSGPESSEYLQGLITNDIEHLNSPNKSMFTMFLNTRGRVLYDAIIYRSNEENSFLIECDKAISNSLQKLMKMYRIKRKVEITAKDDLQIHALFDNANLEESVSVSTLPKNNFTHKNLAIFRDPRISLLGARIISNKSAKTLEEISEIIEVNFSKSQEKNYRWLRYTLGVGEGIKDLPPGECFPLECNCDYLHGVSFHKGCYIGQELTARVHHTGVVRKRLMPIHFKTIPTVSLEESIIHENVNLGKFRGIEHNAGLALIRFAKALQFTEIAIGDGVATTSKPFWWPHEAPKEQINKAQ